MRISILQVTTKGEIMLRILILLLILVSCSSHDRTKYGTYSKKNGGGYQDKAVDDLKVVSFKANSYTKKHYAIKFAKFRAIEICTTENSKLTHLLDTFDKTQSKTITRTSSSGYPSYYYGMSPFYSRYSGFGYGFGFSTTNTNSWNETLNYPDIEVVFECANEVYEPKVEFREVPADEMKLLVKDLRGGLQVEKIPADSPNAKDLMVGDILIRANGERVQQIYQLLSLFHKSKNHKLAIEILRNGLVKTGILLVGVDATEKILEAQKEIIKSACKQEEIKTNPLCK
jgi:hypothetical protein